MRVATAASRGNRLGARRRELEERKRLEREERARERWLERKRLEHEERARRHEREEQNRLEREDRARRHEREEKLTLEYIAREERERWGRVKTSTQLKNEYEDKKDKDKECSICIEEFIDRECIVTTCMHKFHRTCFLGLCAAANNPSLVRCPLCRCELIETISCYNLVDDIQRYQQ